MGFHLRASNFLIVSFLLLAHSVQLNDAFAQTEELIVSGQRPGPPLWQLRNGENTLWIFGVASTMPSSFEWDSSSVDYIISESETYISPPKSTLSAGYNPLKLIGAYRRFKKVRRISDKQSLSDILPPEVYQKFLVAKQRYLPKDKKILKLTPFFAADRLYKAALKHHKLEENFKIFDRIERTAKRAKNKIEHSAANEKADITELLNDIEDITDEQHLECFSSTLASLGSNIEIVSRRSQVWASGNAQALVSADFPRSPRLCVDKLYSNQQIHRIVVAAEGAWLEAAERALKENKSSFTALELERIVEPENLVSKLLDKGYILVGPQRENDAEKAVY